jgi:hypothetical protein
LTNFDYSRFAYKCNPLAINPEITAHNTLFGILRKP